MEPGGKRTILALSVIAVHCLAVAHLACASAEPLDAALAYADANQEKFNNELLEFVSIPSISALPEHRGDIERAAEWLRARLGTIGFKVLHYYGRLISEDAEIFALTCHFGMLLDG